MAPSSDARWDRWDRWRNAIHTLYVVEKKPLTGNNGVMSAMKEKHNFEASKPQYERRLAKWGFIKKATKESWQISNYKVKKRKDERKETLVYRDGVLIPPEKAARELSRQGHMTAIESAKMELGPSPRTPESFDFRTPSDGSVVRLDLEGLPVLQYMRTIQGFAGFSQELSPPSPSNSQVIRASDTTDLRETVGGSALVGLNLPLSTLEDGTAEASPFQQACRMAFSVSNNLSGNTDKSNVYQWLERQGLSAGSDLTIFRGPTGEALLEKLFPMAVEMGHLGAVKQLLAAGADPNESLCSAPGCAVMLTPLQYACLVGNTPLVRVLHDAGALVNDNPFGWQGSILVLAMLRCGLQPRLYLHENHQSCFGDNECRSNCYRSKVSDGTMRAAILELVNILLSLGAEVNNPGRWVSECREATACDEERHNLEYPLVFEAHSPLTMAASYSLTKLVEVFLQAGADVHYCVNGVGSALQHAIYPFHYASGRRSLRFIIYPPPDAPRLFEPGAVDTVKALLKDGASPDRCDLRSGDRAKEHLLYSPLDHALESDPEIGVRLAEILLSNGASFTIHTLRLAFFCRDFRLFCRILSLLETPSDKTRMILKSRSLGIFGLTYSKGALSSRDVYKTLVLGGFVMGSEASFEDALLSNPIPDVLSDCRPPFLLPNAQPEEEMTFHAKVKLLEWVSYLGAPPGLIDVFEGFLLIPERKVRREPPSLPSPYPPVQAAPIGNEGPCSGSTQSAVSVAHGTSYTATLTQWNCGSVGFCSRLIKATAFQDWSLTFQLSNARALQDPHCWKRHIAPLGALILEGAPLAMIRSFLQEGADPNTGAHNDVDGCLLPSRYTPLFCAAFSNKKDYVEAIVPLLLQHGADPTRLTFSPPGSRFSDTALSPVMVAVEFDHLGTAGILLDHGAGSGWHPHSAVLYSPLQVAAYRNREESVRLLLDRGADPNDLRTEAFSRQKPIYYGGKDYIGSPIQSAVVARNLTVVDMLLRSNALPDLTTPLTPHTPLQIACRKRLDAIARLLVEYGAEVNAPPAERHGATALQFAAINCRLELAQMLVQKGADVNAPPAAYEGRTALEGAAEHGRIDMVQYLVNVGADISGEQYERALERARGNGHFSVWKLLASYLS